MNIALFAVIACASAADLSMVAGGVTNTLSFDGTSLDCTTGALAVAGLGRPTCNPTRPRDRTHLKKGKCELYKEVCFSGRPQSACSAVLAGALALAVLNKGQPPWRPAGPLGNKQVEVLLQLQPPEFLPLPGFSLSEHTPDFAMRFENSDDVFITKREMFSIIVMDIC